MNIELKPALRRMGSDVMSFLNEVAGRYPAAISLAAGRPLERFFDHGAQERQLARYVSHVASTTRRDEARVRGELGQYGKTNGIIRDLVARHLLVDEGVRVDERAVMITNGAQEAMSILLQGLFEPGRDALLVTDPSYIGITGAAAILGIDVEPVRCASDGLELDDLQAAIARVRARGLVARALYDIPDFHNPQGTSTSLDKRRALLALALAERFFVIEDNPYGLFAYDASRLPTMKSLDDEGCVVYIGTFSKSLYPALRVGYLVADQGLLAEKLAVVKGLVTVNTSTLAQAVVGGCLLENDCSLVGLVQPKVDFYRANRDRMLAALALELGGVVTWNHPSGGFFVCVDLPFECSETLLVESAEKHGVLWVPMSFFSLRPGRERTIRLSFSYVEGEQLDEGVARFARFVRETMKSGI